MSDRNGQSENHLNYSWQCKSCSDVTALIKDAHKYVGNGTSTNCKCGDEEFSPTHIQEPNPNWIEAIRHAQLNPNHEVRIVLIALAGAKIAREKVYWWVAQDK